MKRFALIFLALYACSCGSTGGKLVTLSFSAGGVQRASGPFTFTAPCQGTVCTPWTVTLQKARIALGPFYLNRSAPSTSTFRSGVVILEATEQVIVDPLDPALKDVPGGADGETGDSVAAEIDLFPPDSHASSADRALLGGNVGFVSGTATNGTSTVSFAGPISINTRLVTPETPLVALERVNGASASLSVVDGSRSLELRVDPKPWFAGLDFSALAGGAAPLVPGHWDPANCDRNSTLFDSARCSFQNALLGRMQQRDGVYLFSIK